MGIVVEGYVSDMFPAGQFKNNLGMPHGMSNTCRCPILIKDMHSSLLG